MDSLAAPLAVPFTVMRLLYDPARDSFLDRADVYPDLRAAGLTWVPDGQPAWVGLCEAARLVSRYHYAAEGSYGWAPGRDAAAARRTSATCSPRSSPRAVPTRGWRCSSRPVSSPRPGPSWPRWRAIPHVKDYHPEGNVWEHTLETLKYRKRMDFVLSLALLLHDAGKPEARGLGRAALRRALRAGRARGVPVPRPARVPRRSWCRTSPSWCATT